ncbi:hypothetical protein CSUB01_05619 [Colletotrichum sublineola]|uniref:Uncharacterized protein n=1 Tax=Colletotrichum sublineola TaxID=1173701 RepID=A0A066XTA6_COLSU|nr:hypothetical protein CSUB01_05619 [Colletotrichum sublineola]
MFRHETETLGFVLLPHPLLLEAETAFILSPFGFQQWGGGPSVGPHESHDGRFHAGGKKCRPLKQTGRSSVRLRRPFLVVRYRAAGGGGGGGGTMTANERRVQSAIARPYRGSGDGGGGRRLLGHRITTKMSSLLDRQQS